MKLALRKTEVIDIDSRPIKPRVRIGSAYFPSSFERRTATSYSALCAPMSGDMVLLQTALLNKRPRLAARLWSLVRVV